MTTDPPVSAINGLTAREIALQAPAAPAPRRALEASYRTAYGPHYSMTCRHASSLLLDLEDHAACPGCLCHCHDSTAETEPTDGQHLERAAHRAHLHDVGSLESGRPRARHEQARQLVSLRDVVRRLLSRLPTVARRRGLGRVDARALANGLGPAAPSSELAADPVTELAQRLREADTRHDDDLATIAALAHGADAYRAELTSVRAWLQQRNLVDQLQVTADLGLPPIDAFRFWQLQRAAAAGSVDAARATPAPWFRAILHKEGNRRP